MRELCWEQCVYRGNKEGREKYCYKCNNKSEFKPSNPQSYVDIQKHKILIQLKTFLSDINVVQYLDSNEINIVEEFIKQIDNIGIIKE